MSDNNNTNMPTEEVMVVQGAVPHVDDVNDGDIEDNGATIEDVNSNNKDMNATEVTTSSTLTTKQKQEKQKKMDYETETLSCCVQYGQQ